MEPIISPWIFYWMDVANAVKILMEVTTTIFIVASLLSPIWADEVEHPMKIIKPMIAVAVVLMTLSVFVPSKDTMYKMLITSYVTPNNIELVGGSIDTALDKLTDKVVKIKEAK